MGAEHKAQSIPFQMSQFSMSQKGKGSFSFIFEEGSQHIGQCSDKCLPQNIQIAAMDQYCLAVPSLPAPKEGCRVREY